MRKPTHSRLRAALLPLALGTCGSIGLQAVSAPAAHADHPRHGQPADRSAAVNRLGRFLGIGWSDGYHACQGCCEASGPWGSATSYHASSYHASPPAAMTPLLPAAPWPAAPGQWLPPQPAVDAVPEELSPLTTPPDVPAQLTPPAAATSQPEAVPVPLPQAGVPHLGSAEDRQQAQGRLSSHRPRRLPKPAPLEQETAELSVLLGAPAALRPVSLPLRPWEPIRSGSPAGSSVR